MKNLRILVPGATAGIGRVTAELLAARAAVGLVHGRDPNRVSPAYDPAARGRLRELTLDLGESFLPTPAPR